MKFTLSAVIVFIFHCQLMAQEVSSKTYQFMLQTLLAHSVPEQAVVALDTAHRQYLWLDARTQQEYAVSHIRGAHWVGYDDFTIERVPHSQDRPMVVYCSVGYRSEKIAEKLIEAGYQEVYNLYGGIFEWVNQGYPVYDAQGETNRVHAYNRMWGVWLRAGEKVFD